MNDHHWHDTITGWEIDVSLNKLLPFSKQLTISVNDGKYSKKAFKD